MFITQILDGLTHLHKPQRKFLQVLFTTFLVCQAKINFSSLARHSSLSEKTYRRNFRKKVDFVALNQAIVERCRCDITAFAMDASFIRKSGKATFGLDKFWNGCASRAEKGLEVSLISLVDAKRNASFALTLDQTEAQLAVAETAAKQPTRIDFYAAQVEKVAAQIKQHTTVGLFDGYYAKEKFVARMTAQGFTVISRLRQDANLKYFYVGAQKKRGRPRKYDGKVAFTDLRRLAQTTVVVGEKAVQLFSQVVWSVSLQRAVKLVVVHYGKRQVNLFATALEMPASDIFWLYRSRFTIEFLLRDAKQSGGLNDCQARDNEALEFHWNTALTTVNVSRALASEEAEAGGEARPFSMKSIKQQYFNEHLLKLFMEKLGLEQSWRKCQETIASLRNYATTDP